MAIITAGYVDNAIGTDTRIALVGTASGPTSAFAQHERAARAAVASKALVKGYAIGTSSTNDFVQLLVLGQWYFFAAGLRKGMDVPPAVADAIAKLEQVAATGDGALPIPGMSPSTRDGISGVRFSRSTGADGRVQYFSRNKMRSWG